MHKLRQLGFLSVLSVVGVSACSSTSSSDTAQDSESVSDAYGSPADTNAVETTTQDTTTITTITTDAAVTTVAAVTTDAKNSSSTTAKSTTTTAAPVTTTTSAPEYSGSTQTVTTKGLAFTPTSLSISVGQSVAFVVSSSHTVSWQDGDPGRGATDAAYSRTFSKTGTYSFYCSIHSSMTGTITVG